jgi:hypothetical protein
MPKHMNDDDRGYYELITKGDKKWP